MHLEMVVLTTHHHPIGPQGAMSIIGIGETKDLSRLGSLHPPQTVGSRATGVCYQQCPQCHPDLTGQMNQDIPDEEACMKINLPIFKDEDAKDAVTYQSWRLDLTMYRCAGCRDHTLLPYAVRSLQGNPGELVWSSGTDITLDDMLTILDEHYNNVKALDMLNQELFQLQMADKETVSDWSICLSRHLQVLATSFPDHFPPDHVMELKRDRFYSRLPK